MRRLLVSDYILLITNHYSSVMNACEQHSTPEEQVRSTGKMTPKTLKSDWMAWLCHFVYHIVTGSLCSLILQSRTSFPMWSQNFNNILELSAEKACSVLCKNKDDTHWNSHKPHLCDTAKKCVREAEQSMFDCNLKPRETLVFSPFSLTKGCFLYVSRFWLTPTDKIWKRQIYSANLYQTCHT